MSIIVMGTNYKHADVTQREAARVSQKDATRVLCDLCEEDGIAEAVVLSTCNRTELYLSAATDRTGIAVATSYFACKLGADYDQSAFYTYRNDGAVRWLMRVAASLDSQVLGEDQILGQVRDAFDHAQKAGTCKEVLGKLFKDALHVGKRVRTETEIGRESVSLSTVAMGAIGSHINDWSTSTVLVVGSGEMARLAARYLAPKGVGTLVVASRSLAHAQEFAADFDAEAIAIEDVHTAAAQADAVFSAVTCDQPILSSTALEEARAATAFAKPLVIVDVGLPRNIEEACGELDGITLRDLDHLSDGIDKGLRSRQACVSQAETICEQGVQGYLSWLQARMVQPTIKEMHARCNSMVQPEVERAAKALRKAKGDDLSEDELKALKLLANSVVTKLLHGPSARLRSEAQSGDSSYLTTSARYLFGLDTHPLSTHKEGGAR